MTAREYLFSLEQFGIKLGLDQIRALLAALGFPDRAYRSVVIAGTNGKGSVTAMVERGLRAAGYRTGRYTSPHLVALEERFAIDGHSIPPADLDIVAERIRAAAEALPVPPSFFEATTALALESFRRAAIDVAVMEVGLGGRLDATNVLSPMAVAITAIDLDHEAHLGSTIEAIAREKAGVIKPDGLCVLGRNGWVAHRVVEDRCAEVGARLVDAAAGVDAIAALDADGRTRLRLRTPACDYGTFVLALRGRHQIDNAITAVRLLESLAGARGVRVAADHVRTALTDVEWPARLELHHTGRGLVLMDGAHNPAGARTLAAYLDEVYARRLPFVLGVMRDKRIDDIVAALAPCASVFVCTAPDSPRAATPAELSEIVRRSAPLVPVRIADTPAAALQDAFATGDLVVVAGSLHLAGAIRAELS